MDAATFSPLIAIPRGCEGVIRFLRLNVFDGKTRFHGIPLLR